MRFRRLIGLITSIMIAATMTVTALAIVELPIDGVNFGYNEINAGDDGDSAIHLRGWASDGFGLYDVGLTTDDFADHPYLVLEFEFDFYASRVWQDEEEDPNINDFHFGWYDPLQVMIEAVFNDGEYISGWSNWLQWYPHNINHPVIAKFESNLLVIDYGRLASAYMLDLHDMQSIAFIICWWTPIDHPGLTRVWWEPPNTMGIARAYLSSTVPDAATTPINPDYVKPPIPDVPRELVLHFPPEPEPEPSEEDVLVEDAQAPEASEPSGNNNAPAQTQAPQNTAQPALSGNETTDNGGGIAWVVVGSVVAAVVALIGVVLILVLRKKK